MVLKNYIEANDGDTFIESLRNDSIITTFNNQTERIMFGLWNWSPFYLERQITHFKDNLCTTLHVNDDSIGIGNNIIFHALSANEITFGPISLGSNLMLCDIATVTLCEPIDILRSLYTTTLELSTHELYIGGLLKIGHNIENAFNVDGIDLEVDRMEIDNANPEEVVDVTLVHEPGTLTFDVNYTFTYDIFDMEVSALEMNASMGPIAMIISKNVDVHTDLTSQNMVCMSSVQSNSLSVSGHTRANKLVCNTNATTSTLSTSSMLLNNGITITGITKIMGATRFENDNDINILGFNNNLSVKNAYCDEHMLCKSLIVGYGVTTHDMTCVQNTTISRDANVASIAACSQFQIQSCAIIGSTICNNLHLFDLQATRLNVRDVNAVHVDLNDCNVTGTFTTQLANTQALTCHTSVSVDGTTQSNNGNFQSMSTYATIQSNTTVVRHNAHTSHPVNTQNLMAYTLNCANDVLFSKGVSAQAMNVGGNFLMQTNAMCNNLNVSSTMICSPFSCTSTGHTQNIQCIGHVNAQTGNFHTNTKFGNVHALMDVRASNLNSNVYNTSSIHCQNLFTSAIRAGNIQCNTLSGNLTCDTIDTGSVLSGNILVKDIQCATTSNFQNVRMNGGTIRDNIIILSGCQNANVSAGTMVCNVFTTKTASGVKSLTCPSLTVLKGSPVNLSISKTSHFIGDAQIAQASAVYIKCINADVSSAKMKSLDISNGCNADQAIIHTVSPQDIQSESFLSVTTRRPIQVIDLVVTGQGAFTGATQNVSCQSLVTHGSLTLGTAKMPTFSVEMLNVRGSMKARQLIVTSINSHECVSTSCVAQHIDCMGLGIVKDMQCSVLHCSGINIRDKASVSNLTITSSVVANGNFSMGQGVNCASSVHCGSSAVCKDIEIARNFDIVKNANIGNSCRVQNNVFANVFASGSLSCSSLVVSNSLGVSTTLKVSNCATTNSLSVQGTHTCTSMLCNNDVKCYGQVMCMGLGVINIAQAGHTALDENMTVSGNTHTNHLLCTRGSFGSINSGSLNIQGGGMIMDSKGIKMSDLIVNNVSVTQTFNTLPSQSAIIKVCALVRDPGTGRVRTELRRTNASVPLSIVPDTIVAAHTMYNSTFNGNTIHSVQEIFSLNPKRVVCDQLYKTFTGVIAPRPNPEFDFLCEQITTDVPGKILVKNMVNPQWILVGPRSTVYIQWPGDTPRTFTNLSWNAQKRVVCPFSTGAFYAWVTQVADEPYGCVAYSSTGPSDDFIVRLTPTNVVVTMYPRSQATFFHSGVPSYWTESVILDNPGDSLLGKTFSLPVTGFINTVRINKMLTGAYVRFYASDGKWLHFSEDSYVAFAKGERYVQQLDVTCVIVDRDIGMLHGMIAPREDTSFSPVSVVLGAGAVVDLSGDGVSWLHITESVDLDYYGFYGKAKQFRLLAI